MQSCIIIAPFALLPAADAFAMAVGLATGQFTQPYGEDDSHRLCHFRPSPTALSALEGDLPEWLQVIITDNPDELPWDALKVGVFLSSSQDGWVHKAIVDSWGRVNG